jgi:hypothetical protein
VQFQRNRQLKDDLIKNYFKKNLDLYLFKKKELPAGDDDKPVVIPINSRENINSQKRLS